ncbi:hypothetical protein [Granulibacter bethesdensis]|nr:hypothetical protein [Granulibacter bethesdensis]
MDKNPSGSWDKNARAADGAMILVVGMLSAGRNPAKVQREHS